MKKKKKKNKNKNNSSSRPRRTETKPVICPECGKKSDPGKNNFCPSCGRELFTPVFEKKLSIKIFMTIAFAVATFYIIYLLLKDPIYYWLDKVPYR